MENRLGSRNAKIAKEKLEEHGVKIISENIGGNAGRSIMFNLNNGDVKMKKRM